MTDHQAEIAQLQATVKKLTTELDALKQIVANPTPISADAYPQLLTQSAPVNQVLDIPLSKAIDLYRDCPQILEPVARRVAIDKEHFSLDGNTGAQPLTFHANPNGNFWVIQLQSQGHYLFPRPTDSKRIIRLSLLDKIFARKGEGKSDQSVDFEIAEPAQLEVLKLNENWRLKSKGFIYFGNMLLKSQSYSELETIRKNYELLCQKIVSIENKNELLERLLEHSQIHDQKFEASLGKQNELFGQLLENSQRDKLLEHSQIHDQKFEALLGKQNELFEQLLENSQREKLLEQLVKNGEQMDVLLAKTEREEDLFNQSSRYSLLDPTPLPTTEQQQLTSTSVFHQQKKINDPFYEEVISQFKASNDYWFWSLIDAGKFRKVQVKQDSAQGNKIDMGGKITKLILNEQGTLLVYEAANKCWLIPNPVEPKWKRAVTESLFTGTSGTSLVRPAEVEALGNSMWQLKVKGEFQP